MRFRAAAIFALFPGLGLAQEIDCTNALAQSDMNACAYAGFETQDAALNAVWPKAMALMKDIDASLPEAERGAAAQLLAGQKAWISFRDATCAAEAYMMQGGSAQPLLLYGCMARLTEVRAADLSLIADQDY